MKDLNYIKPQQSAKSIKDLTPFELSEIDNFQNANRGFEDEQDDDFEINWED